MAKSSKKTENTQEVSAPASIADLKREFFQTKLKVMMREERNTAKLRQMRKEIARQLTAQNQNK